MFKKRKMTPRATAKLADRAGDKINGWVYFIKSRFARTMSKGEQKLTTGQKKISLLLFCIVMCGMSAYWLYRGIFTEANKSPVFLKQKHITIPLDPALPDSLDIHLLEQYRRLQHADQPDSFPY
ncbi:MAG: hypothetical protein E6Q24_04855 [Chitinophagaceae bacterium]|nr:MAG: hypothetical protein E6Q24_04855 [Chitinophagaceae bacterium]